jgi:hypothetical protein
MYISERRMLDVGLSAIALQMASRSGAAAIKRALPMESPGSPISHVSAMMRASSVERSYTK